ncbi:MAG: methyltransferase domain-containing protein [Treponema sp.]|nr:methyltransferase domain-containing protein [Treponema sp.]
MNIQEQFNLVAKEYDENRRYFIPCFDDYYAGATDFVAKSLKSSPKVIFDLGSGTGLLASFWYKYFPTAKYILADIAEEMLSVAKKRFENLPNVEYKVLDYSGKLPEETPDVIASALSIHHLEDEAKRRLFMNIYKSLPAGGVFVNYDQFCSESLELNEKIEKYWIDEIKASGISELEYNRWLERKKLDRECTVQEEICWLKEAGFANVDCIYLNGKFAVIVAVR